MNENLSIKKIQLYIFDTLNYFIQYISMIENPQNKNLFDNKIKVNLLIANKE